MGGVKIEIYVVEGRHFLSLSVYYRYKIDVHCMYLHALTFQNEAKCLGTPGFGQFSTFNIIC